MPPHGQGGGVRYVPVTCGEAHPYRIGCYSGEVQAPEDGKPIDAAEGEVVSGVFSVLAAIECGPVGYTSAEDQARVRRRLEAGEQGAVEQAFWTGLDFEGESLEILDLAANAEDVAASLDSDTIMGTVAALEDYAYRQQGYGYVAYIHAPAWVANYAAAENLIIPDGDPTRAGRMLTPYGSVWVFGGGYPGTGGDTPPPEGGAHMHITGHTTVWRSSDVATYPVDQVMDRTTNQRLLVAEREYAVAYDCFNGRATFDPLGS